MNENYRNELELAKEGLKRVVDYVKHNEHDLRKKYRNDYVAVMEDCGIIDRDTDELKLSERILKNTHTKRFILVSCIEDILNPKPEFIGGVEVKK